jgi:hypothetical protein
MPTASSISLKDSQSFSPEPEKVKELEDRETFSHQTLILTALTAINNPNHHPSFNDDQVNKERLRYMKEKSTHTPVIDAATTILVTDTEILATMSRGVPATHSIVALKETEKGNDQEHKNRELYYDLLKSRLRNDSGQMLMEMEELLPDEFETVKSDSATTNSNEDPSNVFVSFPNINKTISMQKPTKSFTSSDPICKPIDTVNGHWAQILKLKSGFIFDSTK